MEMKQSFSTSEVATYCHVTADTIRKWAEAGRITVFKTPGGHRRIRREDLTRFLRENNIPVHADLRDDGVKILVVDDEKSVISVIRRFLEHSKTSFEIRVAMDGFEAGQHVGTFGPTVVFLDLRLPGLDGFEVCRRIKASPETAETSIIETVQDWRKQSPKHGPSASGRSFNRCRSRNRIERILRGAHGRRALHVYSSYGRDPLFLHGRSINLGGASGGIV